MLCPLDWWGRWKRGDPDMQVPLLLLLFGVAHTLFPLWRSYSCRGVCVGLPLIHRSSFTFWETWGWTSNWHQAFFVNECRTQDPRRPFTVLPIGFLSPGPRSTAVALQREDSNLEWRWKMRSSDGKMKIKKRKRDCLHPALHLARCQTNSGRCVAV